MRDDQRLRDDVAAVMGYCAFIAAGVAVIGWLASLNVYPEATGMMWVAGWTAAVLGGLYWALRRAS